MAPPATSPTASASTTPRPATPPTSPTTSTPADPAKGPAAGNKPPVKNAPVTTPAVPPARAAAAEAQQRLDIAKAKIANNLNQQALSDLREIVADYSSTPAAAEASLLTADLLEKMNRIDNTMAALVEFDSRFAGDRRVAESELRRAVLLGRTRQPKADVLSRTLLNEVVRDFPGTPNAAGARDQDEVRDRSPRSQGHGSWC